MFFVVIKDNLSVINNHCPNIGTNFVLKIFNTFSIVISQENPMLYSSQLFLPRLSGNNNVSVTAYNKNNRNKSLTTGHSRRRLLSSSFP